jgi:4-hydroxy-3-polyprenylbenzoate decarboxylase
MRLIVGISGATGAILGIKTLEALAELGVETHLILSKWAEATIHLETSYKVEDVLKLATVVHAPTNQAASISSGSFQTDGMVVVPCSMKTLAAIRVGYAEGLIARAADVTLKERRKLVLVTREMPLSSIHLENMLALSQMGAVILPPVMAFYNRPKSVEEMISHVVARTLDQFGIDNQLTRRWASPREVFPRDRG